ncbi:MAG: FkbM family methyltransferase [Acetobacteraceae bacterium]
MAGSRQGCGKGEKDRPAMTNPPRKLAFVLAATDQGTLIVNRFDYRMLNETQGFGVGHELLHRGSYATREVEIVRGLLEKRRQFFGDGVVAVDCGANIGVFTVEWAKAMTGWGYVLAIEAQERVFYALAGNIAINNCFNARAIHAAVAATSGVLRIPRPDYLTSGSFGSLELKPSEKTEFIGQPISYDDADLTPVQAITIDGLALPRLDVLKIDVERMELEVLEGARDTIGRLRPIIVVERIKTGRTALAGVIDVHGYRRFDAGMNIVAVHEDDPIRKHVRVDP